MSENIITTHSGIQLKEDGHVHTLWKTTQDLWEQSVRSRFVQELYDGTLDDAVLASYLVQDYQFFDAFLSMIGSCVACADTMPAKLRFCAQLGMLADDEDGYFEAAFDEFGVPASDREAPELTQVTEDFDGLMKAAAQQQWYPRLLVMLVIAEWLYQDWGELALGEPERYVHTGWIDLHRGDDFREWAQFLIDELERVFPADDPEQKEQLTQVWAQAVQLEHDFFVVCYDE